MNLITAMIVAIIACGIFILARARAVQVAGGRAAVLHSRPSQHGTYGLILTVIVGFGIYLFIYLAASYWQQFSLSAQISAALPDVDRLQRDLVASDVNAILAGHITSQTGELRSALAVDAATRATIVQWLLAIGAIGGALLTGLYVMRQITIEFRARNRAERMIRLLLWLAALVAVLTTIGIVLSLIFETLRFFEGLNWRLDKFLFGTRWSPLAGVQDGVMDPNKVGAVPLFAGTLMITAIAMLVAVPIGLFAAIYLSDFASSRVRAVAKPLLEILAGIPTVVYGFFAAITVAPAIRGVGESIGLSVASESALAAGVVMGIMIIPFISSLSDDVINAVPQSLRDGSYGLGATKAETIRQVVLPAALPGIVSAVLLGVSRAVGETMIVVMAAGQGANLTANPLEAVTTVTVQIVMLITGDTEASTAAGPAFTLCFTLFCITLALNVFALRMVRKYREMYD